MNQPGRNWVGTLLPLVIIGSGALLLTEAFVGFALGLLSATRLELYLRAGRILETA